MTENLDRMMGLLANMEDMGGVLDRMRSSLHVEVEELRDKAHGQLTLGLGGLGGEVDAVDGGVDGVDRVGPKTDDEAPVGVMELEARIEALEGRRKKGLEKIGEMREEKEALAGSLKTAKAELMVALRNEEKSALEAEELGAAKLALETTISRALDQLVKPGDAQGILMGAIHILKGGAEAGGENLYAGQCEHGVPIGQGCEACGRVIGGQGECRQDAGGPSEDETKTKR